MLNLAVLQPDSGELSLYRDGILRSNAFQITHVVGSDPINHAALVSSEDALVEHKDEFDACIVHSFSRPDVVRRLAESNKPILIAPSCLDVETLTELASDCSSHTRFSVMQSSRFTAYAASIREGLDAGHIGKPGLIRIHHWTRTSSSLPPQRQLWRLLTGEIDMACWLFDSVPDVVFATSMTQSAHGLHVHLGFPSGMALIDCVVHPRESYYSASLIGSNGAAYADDHRNVNLLLRDRIQGLVIRGEDNWLRGQLEHFSASLAANISTTNQVDRSVEEAKRALVWAHAAVKAADRHRSDRRTGDHYEQQ